MPKRCGGVEHINLCIQMIFSSEIMEYEISDLDSN